MTAVVPHPDQSRVSRVRALLKGLNSQQLEAAVALTGPTLILAGAGTGKTKVMTTRIAILIEEGAHPSEILAVTFTNKAASEMAERLRKMTPHLKQQPLLLTFHSFCVRVLRKHMETVDPERDGNFTISDSDQSEKTVKEAIKACNFKLEDWKPSEMRHAISGAKNRGFGPNDSELFRTIDIPKVREDMRTIYRKYEELMRANNAVDFDDLLLLTVHLLRRHESVRDQYHRLYKHVSVDEFQDTNDIQSRLIDLITLNGSAPESVGKDWWEAEGRSLMVIGDDMQGIYGFRGSKIEIIRNFEARYRAQLITLEENYRSSGAILEIGNRISAQAGGKFKKILRSNKYQGNAPEIKCYESGYEEADDVSLMIAQRLQQTRDNCAVLYRTTAQARLFEDALRKRGIRYSLTGGLSFFERAEIKDVLAYIRYAQNPKNSQLFKRIVNLPKRGVGDTAMAALEQVSIDHLVGLASAASLVECPTGIKPATWKKIRGAKETLDKTSSILQDDTKKLAERLKEVITLIGYEKHLEDTYDDAKTRLENVSELISAAASFNDGECTLEEFLDYASLNTSQREETDEKNRVSISTIHGAKGLEFPFVAVVGIEENFLPHINAIKNGEVDEELRLYYVAVTRAMDTLILTHAERRVIFGEWQARDVSRFLHTNGTIGSQR